MEEISQMLDIADKLHRSIQTLSGGEWQRVRLVGMCLQIWPTLNPYAKLLILDEPVASLDPITRRKFMADLFELALESGSCVLFSSHITSDLERVASHLALLKNGELVIFKEIDELRERVKLLKMSASAVLPSELNVLQRNGNNVLVDNYQQQDFAGLISADSLNLEQLFMELH